MESQTQIYMYTSVQICMYMLLIKIKCIIYLDYELETYYIGLKYIKQMYNAQLCNQEIRFRLTIFFEKRRKTSRRMTENTKKFLSQKIYFCERNSDGKFEMKVKTNLVSVYIYVMHCCMRFFSTLCSFTCTLLSSFANCMSLCISCRLKSLRLSLNRMTLR